MCLDTDVTDMTTAWVTTMSTHPAAVINPLNAACNEGYIPDRLYFLENPSVTGIIDEVIEKASTVVEAYADQEPELDRTVLQAENDYLGIVDHFRTAISDTREEDGTVAVDVTPGRKFMSAIAFQSGIQFEADHVYYYHVKNTEFYGRVYPDVPRPAGELVDFHEVFQ